MREKLRRPVDMMYVKPSYAVHFRYAFMPKSHEANVYGLKYEDAVMLIVQLDNKPEIVDLWWAVSWKETRRSRWHHQEHHVRKSSGQVAPFTMPPQEGGR